MLAATLLIGGCATINPETGEPGIPAYQAAIGLVILDIANIVDSDGDDIANYRQLLQSMQSLVAHVDLDANVKYTINLSIDSLSLALDNGDNLSNFRETLINSIREMLIAELERVQ